MGRRVKNPAEIQAGIRLKLHKNTKCIKTFQDRRFVKVKCKDLRIKGYETILLKMRQNKEDEYIIKF